MRPFLLLVALLTAALSARAAEEPRPNTLTATESADGWSLLFDGEKFSGFQIQGDYEVKDGGLILGGQGTTRLITTRPLLRDFELRLQYRVENPPGMSKATTGMSGRESLFGGGMASWSLWESDDPKAWAELIFKGELNSDTGKHRVYATRREEPGGESQEQASFNSDNSKQLTAWFEVPPGSKLYLRNVKLKADPVSWWDTPWPYLAILVAGLLAFCVMLWIAWRILRRRWAVADAKPPA